MVVKQPQPAIRTAFADYPQNPLIDQYKEVSRFLLQVNFPSLTHTEIESALDWSISKRLRDAPAVINNNYKKQQVETTIVQLADYIMTRQPIISAYGVMFHKHADMPNPVYTMIDGFINERKASKKEMFKYPKGSEDYEKWNLIQLLNKLDANGFYGASGMYTCVYYNLYAAASITIQGRSAISAAALFFESFFNNNVPFESFNELMNFVYNVMHEERQFSDSVVLDEDITLEECFYKLMCSCGFGWIPTENEMLILWDFLQKVPQEDLNRLYYKNHLFRFIENSHVQQLILSILATLDAPFMDPNNPPDEIKDQLEMFHDLLHEYVYSGHQLIDRIEKMDALIRSVSIIQDTDSSIVSLDGWYQKILSMTVGLPLKIKKTFTDLDAAMEGETKIVDVEPQNDYDFFNEDIIEMKRAIDPMIIIPQDGLRYSIINIIAYVVSKLVNEYMANYCRQLYSTREDVPCLLSLKNEFLNVA